MKISNRLLLGSLVLTASVASSSVAFAQDADFNKAELPCRGKRDFVESQGIDPANQRLASIYSEQTNSVQDRFIVLAEFGDQKNSDADDIYNGWLKVMDRTTGKVEVIPITGPSNREPIGAYRLPAVPGSAGAHVTLQTVSPSLKGSHLGFGICGPTKGSVCMSQANMAKFKAMVGSETPLVIAMPSSHNTGGGSSGKRAEFSNTNVNESGVEMVNKKIRELGVMSMSPHLCDGLLLKTRTQRANLNQGTNGAAPAGVAPTGSGSGVK